MSLQHIQVLRASPHALDAAGGGSSRNYPARGIASSNTLAQPNVLALADALLSEAPGIVLLLDAGGYLLESSACARAAWPHIEQGNISVSDFIDAPLAREWVDLCRTVARDRAPLAVRGIVKGEWLWLMLTPVESGNPAACQVLATLRPMSPDSIHTPPVGIDPRIRIMDADNHDLGMLSQLSKREIEVLSLVGVGLTTGQIAKSLHRSLKTVENHRTAIGRKLNARSLLDLCRIARRAGMPESTPLFVDRVHVKGEFPHIAGN